jgi:serine/threonine-protein kinase
LLAGRLPYAVAESGRGQLEQAVLHQEPRRLARSLESGEQDAVARNRSTSPANLRRDLSGDLENIVQKALKKRPEERYATVAAFADDITRYLQGEPVTVRADSAWYRLRKFAQRNRLAVGAAAVVVVALGIGLAVSLWQLQVARAERRHAEEVKDFMASVFRSTDPFYTGKQQMTAAELLALARERIDKELVSQPQTAVEMLTLVGETQGSLEQRDAAEATLAKAIDLAERLQPRDEVLLAEARGRLAIVHLKLRGWTQGRPLAEQALPVLRSHQPRTGRMLSEVLIALAYPEADDGHKDSAVAHAQEAVAAVTAALGPDHLESILARIHLGGFLGQANRNEEARDIAERALRDARALSSLGARNRLLAMAERLYGYTLVKTGEYRAAIPHLNSAIDMSIDLNGPKNNSTFIALSDLGRAQERLGDYKALLVTRRRAYESAMGERQQARMLNNLARSTLAARQLPEALELLPRAVELGMQHDTGMGSWLWLAQSDYGAALALSGRFGEAERLLQATLPLAREAARKGSLASTLNATGLTRQLQSKWAESESLFREALANTDADAVNEKHRADAIQGIGIARLELGHAADAEIWLRQAEESQGELFEGMTPLRADIAMNLGRALLAQGKIEAANESFAVANTYWLGFDAANRCAGLAAYWKGQGHLAAGAKVEARAEFTRVIDILGTSPLPGDARLVRDARTLREKS